MNYRRGEWIGAGGMSHVYQGVALEGAAQPQGTPVALKYVMEQYLEDPTYFERFLLEVLTCHRIDSPNITRGYDVQMDGDSPVYIMELLTGETLADYIGRDGALDEDRALGVAISVASGLAAAHALPAIHRDIKPANIHLGRGWPNEVGSVKIMDFGIVRTGASGLTVEGRAMGTPRYMSPEQILGTPPISTSTDLYALGVVMYEMLSGRPPFEGDDMTIMRKHVRSTPVPLPETISLRTRLVVERLLSKKVEDRHRDARVLRTELLLARQDLANDGQQHRKARAPQTDSPRIKGTGLRVPIWGWVVIALAGTLLLLGFYGWIQGDGQASVPNSQPVPTTVDIGPQ